jgi:hypothetical protein
VCLLALKHLVSLQARVRPSVQAELDLQTADRCPLSLSSSLTLSLTLTLTLSLSEMLVLLQLQSQVIETLVPHLQITCPPRMSSGSNLEVQFMFLPASSHESGQEICNKSDVVPVLEA